MGKFDGKFESVTTEWETPLELFNELDREFGFTLDVAASHENAKCKDYFTKEDDGLLKPWSGVVWCNPPYGRDMKNWLSRALNEAKNGVTSILLIPARTNTIWFHELCLDVAEVRFIKGRPKFGGMDHGLPQPLALVIYRGCN